MGEVPRNSRWSGKRPLWLTLGVGMALLGVIALAYGPAKATGRTAVPLSRPPEDGPAYGINFISSAEDPADEQQYQNGLATGAGWNRWPLYWFNIEQSPGSFHWAAPDATMQADLAHGLQINAILLGTPGFYTTNGRRATPIQVQRQGTLALNEIESATPQGLYEPIFTDGSDEPGAGKTVNSSNKWGVFVVTAVNRYKPGGVLAQANGWPAGVGITHWEMWNEPDLDSFWDASVADYARLLKVGYLAAKQADPNAQVLFGALANNFAKLDYYDSILAIYQNDPLAARYAYFHDILATHSYFYAWQSWLHVFRAQNSLEDVGLDKPIWLNESGVPAWNDYPGPVWDAQSALRATTQEQASFVIQSAFYALFAGADAIFHFQLYDGCGNQPRHTDFPPHNGELCDANGDLKGQPGVPCAGDANGLFRNPSDAACFTHHPQPESPRPNFAAYRVLTTYLREVEPYWRLRPGEPIANEPSCPGPGGPQEWIAFYQPATQRRIVGLWARCGRNETAVIPATSPNKTALLVGVDGSTQTVTAVNDAYTLPLPAATNRNPFPGQTINTIYPIGGQPVVLIEVDLRDNAPPTVAIEAFVRQDGQIEVHWRGQQVVAFDISVAVDGGAAVAWLSGTTAVSAIYPAQPNHHYTFTVVGRNAAGITSSPASDDASTFPLPERVYLAIVLR